MGRVPMEASSPDAKLSDGREIIINLDAITQKEWRESLNIKQTEKDEMATMSKVSGLTFEELDSLTKSDYQRIVSAYIRKGKGYVNPL